MDHKSIEKFLLDLPDVRLDYPFGEGAAVYQLRLTLPAPSANDTGNTKNQDTWKMFAIIQEGKDPVRISLKCDPKLAEVLREKYESVLPGYHLNKKHWNTLVLTGQLELKEVQDLIRHSYQLVSGQ